MPLKNASEIAWRWSTSSSFMQREMARASALASAASSGVGPESGTDEAIRSSTSATSHPERRSTSSERLRTIAVIHVVGALFARA